MPVVSKNKSRKQRIRDLYAFYYSTVSDRELLRKEANDEDVDLLDLYKSILPWAGLYSHTHTEVVGSFLSMIGWLDPFIRAAKSPNREEAILAVFDELNNIDEDAELEKLNSFTKEERGVVFALFIATIKNLDALAAFGKTMDELVREAETDNEAIFDAVLIDRTVMTHPTIAKKIKMAELIEDGSFMTDLSKSVSKLRARRRIDLDDTRIMIELIDDVIGIDHITYEQIADSLIDDLQIFPGTGKDPVEALKKNVQKRRRSRGK